MTTGNLPQPIPFDHTTPKPRPIESKNSSQPTQKPPASGNVQTRIRHADNTHMPEARVRTSFALLVALLALVASAKAVLYDSLDPDCFWHLRVATQLHEQGIGPIVDDLSYSSIKTPWTPYSWLAELGMKAVWDLGGYQLALFVQAMMMSGFIAFIALASHEATNRNNPLAVIIAAALAIDLSLPYLSFRPVTFVLMLLAIAAWLIFRDRRLLQRSRAVWLLVPIAIVGTNCHFFSIFIPIWLGALLAGAMIDRDGASAKRYGLLVGATLLACLATPMLPGVIASIWNYQFADPMVDGGVIREFRPFYASPVAMIVVAGWLGCLLMHRKKLRPGEWLWVIGSLILLIRLGRFAPVFAIIAAPALAAVLPEFRGSVLQRRWVPVAVAAVLFGSIVRLCIAFPKFDTPMSQWVNRHGEGTPGYPTGAADYVANNISPRSGRLINEFSWGGYLAWRFEDQYQVFLDGRTQLYSPDFWKETYLSDPVQAMPMLKASGADVAILPASNSRFRLPLVMLGWQSVYADDRAEVFVPPEKTREVSAE